MHKQFNIEGAVKPMMLSNDVEQFRINFMKEELQEYEDARTLEDKIDALVDLVVVAMGTAYLHGFDWTPHWEEVFRANMDKVRVANASESKRGSPIDLRKPDGWQGPNHTKILCAKGEYPNW